MMTLSRSSIDLLVVCRTKLLCQSLPALLHARLFQIKIHYCVPNFFLSLRLNKIYKTLQKQESELLLPMDLNGTVILKQKTGKINKILWSL